MFQPRHFAILFFLCIPLFMYSQKSENQYLDTVIKKKSIEYKKEYDFQKASSFFLEKNWDSTIVHSMIYLNSENKKIELDDYCHYFRAFSFKNKKLLKEAAKEFNLVSNKFPFYYKVKLNLGEILLEQGNFEQALQKFEEIEKLPAKKRFDSKTGSIYENLGLCYFHLNKFQEAENYLLKSAALHKNEKDTLLLIGSYINIANLYYEQFEDNQAISYFLKAYDLSKKVKDFDIKTIATSNMAVVEENRKDFKSALAYRKEYEKWKDSLNDQNKIWAIAELEKKFAVKQKQKEIYILETENKIKNIQRNRLLYSTILFLGLFGASIYFYRQKIKTNRIITSQKEELDKLNATKDQLFSIVSHDLRSSVNLLKTSNTKLLENLETKNYVELDKLLQSNSSIANGAYNLLDNLLNWALVQTKQLYFQKENLRLFSIIQQVEYNFKPLLLDKNIHFENLIPKDIFVFADLDSLKIILRNLLDNAIKFSRENGKITIYMLSSDENYCDFVVEDTGLGMSENTKRELLKESFLLSKKSNNETIGTGLGMSLCKTMIIKNGGKLAIESTENIGTKIIISLPTAKNE